jgi:exopolyphosphatase / guanosine-5'-triphosphate,3'-diphosphate pyrophosphatase
MADLSKSDSNSKNTEAPKRVAAIDVGVNSIRMVVAEVDSNGKVTPLERLRRGVRLGQDTFRTGRIGGQTMRATVSIFRDYAKLLALYEVHTTRAVATSAVREASNADALLDRIFMATGVNVHIIDLAEESRMAVTAVRETLGRKSPIAKSKALFVDVGGGSTLVTTLDCEKIVASQSLRLGSIRLQEMLGVGGESPQQKARVFRRFILNETTQLSRSLDSDKIDTLIAVGGDARFTAHQIGKPVKSKDLWEVDRDQFDQFVRRVVRRSTEELTKEFGLVLGEAETLVPALLTYQVLFQKIDKSQFMVSDVSMRDGLLLELAREVTGTEDKAVERSVVESSIALARKYRVDIEHAQGVADLAVSLFDELQADHGLDRRNRLLLRVAGILHEVGIFISNQAHHKHSYYLISHSEIFGLNRDELKMVAHIARYHRKAVPLPSHRDYGSLPRATRVAINKLAALLRVADAIGRGRIQRPGDIKIQRQGDDLIISAEHAADLMLERKSLESKSDLFEDIYGMHIRLE